MVQLKSTHRLHICYDTVCELIRGKNAHVVKIETSELADYANTLRSESRRDRDRGSAAAPAAASSNGTGAASANGQDGKPAWKEFK